MFILSSEEIMSSLDFPDFHTNYVGAVLRSISEKRKSQEQTEPYENFL